MISGFGVAFGANSTGLLVRIADRFNRSFTGQGLIQVHCASSGHQEDMPHPLLRHKADYIIGKFHWSNRNRDPEMVIECRNFNPS
jgi:hypothetical protein